MSSIFVRNDKVSVLLPGHKRYVPVESVDVPRDLANPGLTTLPCSSTPCRRMSPHSHSASCTTSLTFPLSIKMPRNLSNLWIGHLNVRDLERHIDGVQIMLDKHQYHFFAKTETKLKLSSLVGPIRVPGYI